VSDHLVVVTVTYSPGPHLERFLASLEHATERPVTVIMADNGSTDGAPEEALERYPNVRLMRTGANLGYGTAINRAVAEHLADTDPSDFFVVANPDVQWGPNSIDNLLAAAARWPRAAALGPLIRDADGSVYPSAREQPSLIRGGGIPAGPDGAHRASGRMAVRIVSAAAQGGLRRGGRFRRALLHVHGGRRPR
jgi:N-acetylglucosaminyl-diphospho-decaprenol L-rhamnosyltransferase